MKRMHHAWVSLVAIAGAMTASDANAAVIAGPTSMAFNTANWGGSGMVITVKRATSLASVDFWSQGKADTLQLLDFSNNVLRSQAVTADATPATPATIALNWSLTPGTYRFMQTTRDNSQWNQFPPQSNDDLSIDQPGVFYNRAYTSGQYETFGSLWVAFTNITTASPTAAVPEPATWAMLVTGFGLIGGAMRTRRRTRLLAI